ncbi:MAG: hypothetical protein LAO31_18215 [Acidobacteriia bacterium]|nr:hypothetical protein [Terriglobia bacterium]
MTPPTRPNSLKLILIPTLISVAMTLLRFSDELQHWSEKWFSTDTGGITPSGVSWVFGVTWLAFPFGIYFAWKLVPAGEVHPHLAKSISCAALGLIIALGGLRFIPPLVPIGFPRILIVIWLIMVAGALIQFPGWPSLFKILLAYGVASRAVVVGVMFVAMRGNWGTHYDYVGMPPQFQLGFWRGFFWLAFFPQLVFWVAFTILIGSVGGLFAAVLARRLKSAPQANTMV